MSQTPTLSEIISLADILDRAGLYSDAQELDIIIEEASGAEDIIKQAGIISDLWGRMKGRLKRWFIKEFKELHDSAKETQESINKHMDELGEEHKLLQKDLKNYRLTDWRRRLETIKNTQMKIGQMLAKFDKDYGKFLAYIVNYQKQQYSGEEVGTRDIDKMPEEPSQPSGGLSSEMIFQQDLDREWESLNNKNTVQKHSSGLIRVFSPLFKDWQTRLRHVYEKDGKVYILKNRKLPKDITLFSKPGDVFQMVPENDNRYVYLKAPEVSVPKEDSAPKTAPSFPDPKFPTPEDGDREERFNKVINELATEMEEKDVLENPFPDPKLPEVPIPETKTTAPEETKEPVLEDAPATPDVTGPITMEDLVEQVEKKYPRKTPTALMPSEEVTEETPEQAPDVVVPPRGRGRPRGSKTKGGSPAERGNIPVYIGKRKFWMRPIVLKKGLQSTPRRYRMDLEEVRDVALKFPKVRENLERYFPEYWAKIKRLRGSEDLADDIFMRKARLLLLAEPSRKEKILKLMSEE